MSGILGHETQLVRFQKVFKNDALAHAYLFCGPTHVGKFTVAKTLAKFLCCSAAKDGDVLFPYSCGLCESCKAVAAGRHPDVVILDLEHALISNRETRKEIPIEEVKEMKRLFSAAPREDAWRVGIINNAGALSNPAANALLKILEEPGAHTLFFLIAESAEVLPRTIVSRTQQVSFSLVARPVLEKWLLQKTKDEMLRKEILSLSFQRPGIMIRLLEEPEYLRNEEKLYRSFNAACRGGVLEVLSFVKSITEEKELHEKFFRHLCTFLQKNLREYAGTRSVPTDVLARVKKTFSILQLFHESNLNHRLALDVMMLEALGN